MELVEDDGEVGLSRSNFGDISLLHTDISQWEQNVSALGVCQDQGETSQFHRCLIMCQPCPP